MIRIAKEFYISYMLDVFTDLTWLETVEIRNLSNFTISPEKMQGFIRLQLDYTTVIKTVKKSLIS